MRLRGNWWVTGEEAAKALEEDLDEVEAIGEGEAEGLLFEFGEGHDGSSRAWGWF